MSNLRKSYRKYICKGSEKRKCFFLVCIVWLSICPLLVFAQQTKTVSISVKNVTLKQLFDEIEAKSTYKFSYRDNVLENKKDVTVDASDQSVESVLNKVLPSRNLQCQIDGNSITVTAISTSRGISKKISGIIKDEKGEVVIGANVIEKGTTNGTITGLDGDFSLTVPSNAVLQISYIGYNNQEIAVKSQDHLSIKLMEDSQALDEVIVIGYGTTKRQDFTGSVSSVRLENSPIGIATNLNALEAIKGSVPGLDIGATNSAGGEPSMQIRGQKSINGTNSPLIVVDGVIYMGSINDINPNDIASFDILKDATSAAAYGSRSANGVIMITTKKGRTGKPVISFNATGSLQNWQAKPELMTGEQWIESVLARNNSSDLSWMSPQEKANMDAGKITDWMDIITRQGWIQDYQASVSGAGEKMNYYLSTAYSENQGVVVGDNFNRISVLGKVNTDITSWLQIGVDGAYTKIDKSGAAANVESAVKLSPYGVNYRDEEHELLEKFPATQSQLHPLWYTNVSGVRDNINKGDNFRINTFAVVKFPWIEGLSYRLNYTANLTKDQYGDFYYESAYVKEGAYNDQSRYSPSAYQNLLSNANGNVRDRTNRNWLVDNILNYKQTFGKHAIDLTAVATRDHLTYESKRISGSNFAANGNTTLGLDGLHKATVQKIDMSNTYKDNDNESLPNYERSNIGYLGRVSYSFNNRYYFTGSFRRDGSSVFGVNNKWGDYYAFGGAWNVTRESFMEKISKDVLNNLKVKLSWGKNGNQGLTPYGTLSTIKNGSSGGIRYEFDGSQIWYGLMTETLGNANLGWESTQSLNMGFESAWLSNRLFLDVDAYFSKTTDQIFNRNIPVMTGFKEMKSSMGQIDNKGIEITVRSVNIQNQDMQWTTGLTFWLNRNKLAHLYGEDLNGDGKEDDDIANNRFIGKSINVIYGYVQDGIVQESDVEYMKANGVSAGVPKYKDKDGDGVITSVDRDIIGYKDPNFKLNLSNTLTYKNWDLYMMISGTFGGGGYYLLENKPAFMTSSSGIFSTNSIYIPWWTPENKSNIYPSAAFTGDGDRYQGLQSRAFIRLQDVTLSYTFREPWVKKMNIQSLKVFTTAKNLFTSAKWKGGDPEVGVRVGENKLSALASYSLGVNVSF